MLKTLKGDFRILRKNTVEKSLIIFLESIFIVIKYVTMQKVVLKSLCHFFPWFVHEEAVEVFTGVQTEMSVLNFITFF